jgi:hypothetical protein
MEPNGTHILDLNAQLAMHEKMMKNISLLMINSSQLHVNILEVSPEESTALTALYIPIFFIGFLGNITIVLIIGISPPLRNSTNWYLFNLAISDLCGKLSQFHSRRKGINCLITQNKTVLIRKIKNVLHYNYIAAGYPKSGISFPEVLK